MGRCCVRRIIEGKVGINPQDIINLSYGDILHYQKIIVALSETERLMKAIDKIEIE